MRLSFETECYKVQSIKLGDSYLKVLNHSFVIFQWFDFVTSSTVFFTMRPAETSVKQSD